MRAAGQGDRPVTVTRSASEWGPLSPRLRFGLRSPDDRLAPRLASVTPALGGFLLQAQQPLLKRLPPKDRARVLAALAGLIILGFALVLLAWWGARFTRRYLRRPWPGSKRSDAGRVSEFDWASKPMYPNQDGDEHAEGDPRD